MEKMRVFLVQTAQGLTPSSGGYKANISLLRQLRSFGHETAQICYGWDKEVEQFARTAAEKGVEPNVTRSVVNVVDPQDINHELVVETFNDEDQIHNIVISGRPFNVAYPVDEFLYDNKDYLEARIPSFPRLLVPSLTGVNLGSAHYRAPGHLDEAVRATHSCIPAHACHLQRCLDYAAYLRDDVCGSPPPTVSSRL